MLSPSFYFYMSILLNAIWKWLSQKWQAVGWERLCTATDLPRLRCGFDRLRFFDRVCCQAACLSGWVLTLKTSEPPVEGTTDLSIHFPFFGNPILELEPGFKQFLGLFDFNSFPPCFRGRNGTRGCVSRCPLIPVKTKSLPQQKDCQKAVYRRFLLKEVQSTWGRKPRVWKPHSHLGRSTRSGDMELATQGSLGIWAETLVFRQREGLNSLWKGFLI